MQLSDEQKEMLGNMGGLGYPVENIISVMGVSDPEGFKQLFNDPGSEVAKIYKAGSDKAQYILDKKLFDLAAEGNLSALKELEIRKRKMKRK